MDEISEMLVSRNRVMNFYELRTKPKIHGVTWKLLLTALEDISERLKGEGDDVYGNLIATFRSECGLDINTGKTSFETYDRLYGYLIYVLYYKGVYGVDSFEIYSQIDRSLRYQSTKKKTILMIEKTLYEYWGEDEESDEE